MSHGISSFENLENTPFVAGQVKFTYFILNKYNEFFDSIKDFRGRKLNTSQQQK